MRTQKELKGMEKIYCESTIQKNLVTKLISEKGHWEKKIFQEIKEN